MEELEIKTNREIIDDSIEYILEQRLHNPLVHACHKASQAMGLTDFEALYFLAHKLIKQNNNCKAVMLKEKMYHVNKIIFCHECSKRITANQKK